MSQRINGGVHFFTSPSCEVAIVLGLFCGTDGISLIQQNVFLPKYYPYDLITFFCLINITFIGLLCCYKNLEKIDQLHFTVNL